MLDGVWLVYKEDGTYLGTFQTRIGNTILILNEEATKQVSIEDVLHRDEICSEKAWEVRIIGKSRDKPYELKIEKISDRTKRYPKRKFTVKVTSYR